VHFLGLSPECARKGFAASLVRPAGVPLRGPGVGRVENLSGLVHDAITAHRPPTSTESLDHLRIDAGDAAPGSGEVVSRLLSGDWHSGDAVGRHWMSRDLS